MSGDDGDPRWNGSDTELILPPDPSAGHYRYLRSPGLYRTVWENTKSDWEEAVRVYETDPDNFHSSWTYLDNHPMFWKFRVVSSHSEHPANHSTLLEHEAAFARNSIDVMVVRVGEDGSTQHPEPELVRTEVWLEAGQWDLFEREEHGVSHHVHYHDYDLDTGGSTYEEAVVKLARLVWEKYGNDRRVADAPPPASPPQSQVAPD